MKNFEEVLIETFDLKNTLNTKKITPLQAKKLLYEVYADNYGKSDELKNSVQSFNIKQAFTFKDKDEFLVFVVKEEQGYISVHFINLTQKSFYRNENSLNKTSLNVFATVVKILVDYTKKYSVDSIRVASEKNRSRLYQKIISNIIKNELPDYYVKGINTETEFDFFGNKFTIDYVYIKRNTNLREKNIVDKKIFK